MKLYSPFKAILLLLSFAAVERPVRSESHEKQLVDRLFKNYNPMVRPVEDPNERLNVSIDMFLESLKEVNQKDSTITISGWLGMMWKDYYLSWNPADYGNLTFILSPSEKIWRPDVAFNSVVGERVFHVNGSSVGIFNDGTVFFAAGGVTTHFCNLDMTLFPFDKQTCTFVAATWFSTARYITLVPLSFDYAWRKKNNIWKVIGNTSEAPYMDDNFPMLALFTLTLQRKPLYYIVYVIVPLLMLAILNIMVFRVSPGSGEKISLSITILLAFAIWMTMLNDYTPRSSDSIPILGMFITILMLLSAISTAGSVYIVRIYNFDESYPLPTWAEYVVRVSTLHRHHKNRYIVNNIDMSEDYFSAELSWKEVALAMDHIAFVTMLLLTSLLTSGCVIGFIVLEKNYSSPEYKSFSL